MSNQAVTITSMIQINQIFAMISSLCYLHHRRLRYILGMILHVFSRSFFIHISHRLHAWYHWYTYSGHTLVSLTLHSTTLHLLNHTGSHDSTSYASPPLQWVPAHLSSGQDSCADGQAPPDEVRHSPELQGTVMAEDRRGWY